MIMIDEVTGDIDYPAKMTKEQALSKALGRVLYQRSDGRVGNCRPVDNGGRKSHEEGGGRGMKNTLTDLNNYLFEQLERLNDDSLTQEQLDTELKKTEGIVQISEKIIANGELAFRTMKHMDDYGYNQKHEVPPMLGTKGDW